MNENGLSPSRANSINTTKGMHYMDLDRMYREKARRKLHVNVMSYTEQFLEVTSHDTTAIYLPSLRQSK